MCTQIKKQSRTHACTYPWMCWISLLQLYILVKSILVYITTLIHLRVYRTYREIINYPFFACLFLLGIFLSSLLKLCPHAHLWKIYECSNN